MHFIITLGSGGTLTLTGEYNDFSLDNHDREFIDDLVLRFRDYEERYRAPETADNGGQRRTTADGGSR